MGDRVLMQCFSSKSGECGPVVYGHWAGCEAQDIVLKLAKRMEGRGGDLAYSSARLAQEAVATSPNGNTGFGIWNQTTKLTAKDSHGNAGVILIDVDNGHRCECLGGYLKADENGFPVENRDDDDED